MQIVAVSIPQASSFTSQQVSIVHILPCYWVTLSHFDYWDVGSLLGHTQDKPYSHDVRFPSTYLFYQIKCFPSSPWENTGHVAYPRDPWANGHLPLGMTWSWAQYGKQSDAPKKAILLCSTRGIT